MNASKLESMLVINGTAVGGGIVVLGLCVALQKRMLRRACDITYANSNAMFANDIMLSEYCSWQKLKLLTIN